MDTPLVLAIAGLGVPELLIILGIIVLIFGASKLPMLGKGLGEGIRNFKGGLRNGDRDKLKDGAENPDQRYNREEHDERP